MGFLLAGPPPTTPGAASPLAGRPARSGPRVHDQSSRSDLGPLEPVLLSFFAAKARARALGLEQRALEMSPAVARLAQRDAGLVPDEPSRRFHRRQRPFEPGRADLEMEAPGHRLIHVERIRQPPAESGAVPYGNAARFV